MSNEQVSAPEASQEPADWAAAVCELDGCDNPLPPPAVDAHGRRKGGRPSTYCCKAHADAASRARRNAQAAAITEPLAELRGIVETFSPVAQPVLEALGEMRTRLDTAESGALAQVQQAGDDAATARAEAESAMRHAEQAEHARDRALAAARDDQTAREQARQQAQRAEQEAERVQQESWARVAEHERARGTAESAAEAAIQARDAALADLRNTREQLEQARHSEQAMATELEQLQQQLRELTAEHDLTCERLHSAQAQSQAAAQAQAAAIANAEQARQDGDNARAEIGTYREELEQLRSDLADEHTTRRLAETRAETAESALADTQAQLTAAHNRTDQLLERLTISAQDDATDTE